MLKKKHQRHKELQVQGQFFIVVKDSHFLDGQYTAFGRVVKGMDVADNIVDSPRDPRDNPDKRIEMKSVKIVNR